MSKTKQEQIFANVKKGYGTNIVNPESFDFEKAFNLTLEKTGLECIFCDHCSICDGCDLCRNCDGYNIEWKV